MKKVLFLAQNPQELENALPVADAMADWAECTFLSLEAFVQQPIEDRIATTRHGLVRLEPRRPIDRSFYLLSSVNKLKVVLHHQRDLRRCCRGYDAVLAGTDGALEKPIIAEMRRTGRPSYLLLASPYFYAPVAPYKRVMRLVARRLGMEHLVFGQLGTGGCDRIFVPGENSRRSYELLGEVDMNRLEVEGTPRFASLIAEVRKHTRPRILDKPEGEPVEVLYLSSALDWHGMAEEGERHRRQLTMLDEVAGLYAGRVLVHLRLHPRASRAEREFARALKHIRLSNVLDAEEDIARVHVVMGLGSAAFFSAIASGQLVIQLDTGVLDGGFTRQFSDSATVTATTRDELMTGLERCLSDLSGLTAILENNREALFRHISEKSCQAAERIADRLRTDIQRSTRRDAPNASSEAV